MNEEPLRVALSGASGMLGTALRHALSARRNETLQLVRGAPARAANSGGIPAAEPPLADPAALEGLAAAIHLSGASVAGGRWTAAYRREIAVSRVKSTQSLAGLLAGLHRPPRVLLVASAVGFYGDRGEELLDEESAPGTGFLAALCKQWEAAAQPAVEVGIRVVNLRFGVVLGRGPGALARMLPVFRMGLGGRLGTGRQWMSWISLGGRDRCHSICHGYGGTGRCGEHDAPQSGEECRIHPRIGTAAWTTGGLACAGVCPAAGSWTDGR